MSATAYGLACQELEAVDSGIRSLVSVQARSPCSRSTTTEVKSRRKNGSREWRRVKPSAASVSRNPISDPTPPAVCEPTPSATATTGSSTAPRCGSPTAPSRTSPWSGLEPTTACADLSFPPTLRDSPPPRSRTRCRSGRRSPRNWCSRTCVCLPRRCCPSSRTVRPARLPQRGTLRHHLRGGNGCST